MMTTKTKNIKTTSDKLADVAQQAGLLLMTAAFTLSMIEMPEHSSKVVVPNQPALAYAHDSGENNSSTMRREREETGPHYVSYNNAQRTPSRAGKA